MQALGVQLGSSRSPWRESWPPFGGSCGIRRSIDSLGSRRLAGLKCRVLCCQFQVPHSTGNLAHVQKEDKYSCVDKSTSYLHVQSLRNFPIEKLCGEVILVRLDSVLLLDPLGSCIATLDKIPWDDVFSDTERPLIVDIGSGNGLFLFQMARNYEGSNFLGLEMNEKLVVRCLQDVASNEKRNLYFVSTDATSTFRSITSSYPGPLTLVTIQCPNPDFNKEQNRWRMVRRMLVEAVADLLQINGKIYLQSDVQSVLLGMKEQFISHGKGRLVVDGDDGGYGQMGNPFGVASDWERHVLDRGAPMYRTILRKV